MLIRIRLANKTYPVQWIGMRAGSAPRMQQNTHMYLGEETKTKIIYGGGDLFFSGFSGYFLGSTLNVFLGLADAHRLRDVGGCSFTPILGILDVVLCPFGSLHLVIHGSFARPHRPTIPMSRLMPRNIWPCGFTQLTERVLSASFSVSSHTISVDSLQHLHVLISSKCTYFMQ